MPPESFWGKLEHGQEGGVLAWHPLAAHCADVAAVLHELLAPGAMRARLEAATGGPLDEGQVQRLAALAVLHDLGKLNQGFQDRRDAHAQSTCGHVKPLAGLIDRQHLAQTRALVLELLPWFASEEDCLCYLHASFSHHGSPATPWSASLDIRHDQARWWRARPERDPLQGMAELLARCRQWFPLAFDSSTPALPAAPLVSHLFAGLVSLADWLGSDTRWFPFCGCSDRPEPDEDPMPFARQAARRALGEMGLRPWEAVRLNGVPPEFSRQFGLAAPRPLQRAVMDLPLQPRGDLVILEGETGSGKTEAAWLHFMRLFCAGLVDGLYFANPLRLAATQIHQRLATYAAHSFGPAAPPVVLAVPGYLRVDGQEGQRLPGYEVLWPDAGEPERAARCWAAERPKRFLSAPIAAGTVDQVLMAGLRLAHAPLRAAALCRSLLVVDEVHASDAYMNSLLLGLLELVRGCGGQALLMSATLGAQAREAFLAPWRPGAAGRAVPPDRGQAVAAPYPLISCPAGAREIKTDRDADHQGKDVSVRMHPALTKPGQAVALAAQAAEEGAVVLVLRNTVKRAVESFLCLKELLGDGPGPLFRVEGVATLHHGRFAAADRRLMDQRLMALCGKPAGPPGPRRALVVVATQTIEQSLDVDFDLIISDLCPMDVLLQRIGRLHRHRDTMRRSAFQEAVCHVLVPEEGADWLRGKEAHGYGFGLTKDGNPMAYADPRALVAAWRILAGLEEATAPMRIPAMNRDLVEGGLHGQVLEGLAVELGPEWEADSQRLAGLLSHHRQLAQGHAINWREPYGPDSAGVMEDEKVATRLGLSDLALDLPQAMPGPFGQPVQALKVPGWMAQGVGEPVAEDLEPLTGGGGFTFRLAAKQFIYDRLGLRHRGDSHEMESSG